MNTAPHSGVFAKPSLKIFFCFLSFVLTAFTLDPFFLKGNDAFAEKPTSDGGAERTASPADRAATRPSHPLRVLTYNIHHGEGIDGKLDLERIAKVIRSVSPDLVALQEVDRRVERSGSVDQAAELARLTEMHHVFGKNIDLQGGEYGNAVLSKYPILRFENHALLRFDDGEQRGVLEVQISLGEEQPGITFLATHLDHRRDPRERVASVKQINALIETIETPIALLAGDLNATPESEPLKLLSQHWRPSSLTEKKTIPVGEPARQIDYVLYRPGDPLVPIETTVLEEAVASDHRALAASFAIKQFSTRNDQPLERIVFGSCIKQDQPARIFQTIIRSSPDLLLLLGDNIYADTTDMNVMREKYERLAAKPGFAALRSICPTLATWDDHDYGLNDAGSDYPQRESSEQIFLDFWNEPVDAERRSRPGIYASSLHGPPGQRVQIILLDTRYFRSPLKTGERRTGGPYVADSDPDKTMLGEAQWKWFGEQLEVPADLRIIASSIQCVASAAGHETWSNLPHERERLFQTIRDADVNGVVIVSGDRHWAELSVEPDAIGYPLYDMTSSSFNQKHARGTPTSNAFRAQETTFHEENFGVIEIDWKAEQPTVTVRIVDVSGATQIEQPIAIDVLRSD